MLIIRPCLCYGFAPLDDSVQSSRIAATHELLGLDFAQFLPLTQRIGLISMRKADTEAVSMSELLQHTVGMVSQIQELFKRRHAVSAAVQQADHDLRTANAQLDTVKRRVALGEKVRRMQLLRSVGPVGALRRGIVRCDLHLAYVAPLLICRFLLRLTSCVFAAPDV